MSPPACYLCTCSDIAIEHKGVRHDPDRHVYRCQGCQLVFLWPQSDPASLTAYYEAGEYRRIYDPDATIRERYREGLEEARARVERLSPMLTPESVACDVGAGAGSFVGLLQPHVRRVVAVEPEGAGRSWISEEFGIEALASISALEPAAFHLITLFHVLEHVPDPVGFLRRLACSLAPGGRVVIEVPNIRDALLSLYAVPGFSDFYFQKAHLWYFAPETLRRVVERAGLAGEIAWVQRYDLSNHLRWALIGKPGGQGYYRHILDGTVRAAYAEALGRSGVADTLWAVAEPSAVEASAVYGEGATR